MYVFDISCLAFKNVNFVYERLQAIKKFTIIIGLFDLLEIN